MEFKIIKSRKSNDIEKLDFKTNFFLSYIKAKKVQHPEIKLDGPKKIAFPICIDKNEVYVFKDYEEYKSFYLMYFDYVDDNDIKWPIVTRGNKGQIVALREYMMWEIIKIRNNKFYESYTQDMIDDIHLRGNITPMEALDYYKKTNTCIPGNYGIIDSRRCDFFVDCNDCRREMCTHHTEYVPDEEYKKLSLSKK